MVAPAKPSYRLIIALVLAVVMMVLDQRTPWAAPVRHALGYLTAPIHYLAHLPVDSGEWLSEQTQSRGTLLDENRRLQRQALILEQKVQRLAVLEAENVRLRELLNSSADLDANVLVAEIIGVDPDPNRQEIVINKGSGDNVSRGQAVLDSQGLIGQVVDAGPLSSRVLLITDASHAMSVQVNRNGVRAVLAGVGQSSGLKLLYVPDTADIQEGDLLVSTGLGQLYPRGYPVASVTSVNHQAGTPFAHIAARPTAQLDRASHVLLVQPTQTPVRAPTLRRPTMISDRPAGTGVIIVTLLLAALLEVIPLPASIDWVRPEWMLLVLVYWVLSLPHRIGVLWGFFVGLYHDVLVGTTLGQWGLATALGAFVMLAAYKRMRVFTALQQCAVVFLLVGTVSLLAFLVQESVGRTLYPPYTILYSSVTSALLWRPVCAALRWVQLRFLVR